MKTPAALASMVALTVGLTIASSSYAQNAANNGGAAHTGHDHGGSQARDAQASGARTPDSDFARLDANKDGFVARSELPAKHGLLPHFAMADTDKDGKLDKKEFAAGMAML